MNILITGGAGYIGSTVAWYFIDKGHKVTIIDNLKNGTLLNIPRKANFIKSDINNINRLNKLINVHYDVVLHFAGLKNNIESFKKKKKYIYNNFNKSKKFIEFCISKGINNFIFSSTAAIYGSKQTKIKEDMKLKPISPYAISKFKLEKFFLEKKKINYVILRYFNVAGVEKKSRCGFSNKNDNSLFYNLCISYLNNKIFNIFGNNLKTVDGTPIRDFIYVSDLAKIHYFFSKQINKNNYRLILNCGYGRGTSVLEVVNTFNKIFIKKVNYKFLKKRDGDINYSVADNSKLLRLFNLKYNKITKIKIMIKTSVNWIKKLNR